MIAVAEMLRSGTTSFTDMYFFGEETAEEAARVGIRSMVGLTIIQYPSAWAKTSDEYFLKSVDLIQKYQNNPYVTIALAPHAPYTVSDEQFKKTVELSNKYDVKVTCHIHETETEVINGIKEHGVRPIERLNRLGFINDRLLAVHCTQLTKEEIQLFGKSGTSVAHCPESNCKLASGICPVHELFLNGVNVTIGTDSVASNNELDMFGEIKMAAFIGKVYAKDPKANPASRILSMATINGAKAMGIDHITGSLEPGKYADMIAVNLDSLYTVPVYNPISHLVYSVGRENVTDVWVGGERKVRNGHLLAYDEEQLIRIAKQWGYNILHKTYKK
eukprot:TRINITY_DN7950_c0_g1_i1.p1 TRINITY_DN7950_c0_g1~~TRINITY_DN7950_c0_g1_i1.p1  ORF type:complete len:332 (+),score=57.02 TRINITY_DN7950_c0_g1_i1:486-1481(+)